MGLFSYIFGKKVDKAATPGGWTLPVTGGFLPYETGRHWNWWQQGLNAQTGDDCPMVHACVDAYAQTLASLWGEHYRYDDITGGKTLVKNSPLTRIMRNPNGYQTRSDFMLNLVKHLMYTGNAYAVAIRNERNEIESLHIVPSAATQPYIDSESGATFYGVGNNPMLGTELNAMIPARDVLHIKLYTPQHPMMGVSCIENLALSIAANNAISGHQAQFFNNMSRPSGVLATDDKLSSEQMTTLRAAWEDQSQGLNSGGVPILTRGLKWQALSITSQDAQLVEAYGMTNETIARAFRVPLPLVGSLEHATYNNVEQLISSWLSSGLGFLLEHIELAFDKFFDLPDREFTEFNTEALLRTDFAGRIDGLTKGVQGGLFTPNEARAKEGLKGVENGDKPYMQSQMVELGYRPEASSEPPAPIAEPELDDETAKAVALHAIKKAMTL